MDECHGKQSLGVCFRGLTRGALGSPVRSWQISLDVGCFGPSLCLAQGRTADHCFHPFTCLPRLHQSFSSCVSCKFSRGDDMHSGTQKMSHDDRFYYYYYYFVIFRLNNSNKIFVTHGSIFNVFSMFWNMLITSWYLREQRPSIASTQWGMLVWKKQDFRRLCIYLQNSSWKGVQTKYWKILCFMI